MATRTKSLTRSNNVKKAWDEGRLNLMGDKNPQAKYDNSIIDVIISQRQSGIMEYRQLAELHDTTFEYMGVIMRKKWKNHSMPITGEKSKGSGPKSGTAAKLLPFQILSIINDRLGGLSITETSKKYGIGTTVIKKYWRAYNDNDPNIIKWINDYSSCLLKPGEYTVKYVGSKFVDKFTPRTIVVSNNYYPKLKCHYNTIRLIDGKYDFSHDQFLPYNQII